MDEVVGELKAINPDKDPFEEFDPAYGLSYLTQSAELLMEEATPTQGIRNR